MSDLSRIISFWGIGSGKLPEVRYTQFVNAKTGWRGFVASADFQKQLDLGITRFLLWMPFGRDAVRYQTVDGQKFDSNLRFDQYTLALQANLPWLTNGFAEAFKDLTDKGVQVIAYTGALAGAPEFEVASGIARRQWLDAAIEPFEEAGCDYAIDTAVRAPKGHYCSNIADGLRRKGARVYAEAMPMVSASHWCEGDVISVEAQYQAAIRDGGKILCDPKKIVGELVRGFWNQVPESFKNYADWYRVRVPQALGDGHSVCLQLRAYLAQNGKLEELS
jgi:hypothetical protein